MFLKDESGAVTVDWVVLTAALVGLALAVMALISQGVEDLSTDIKDELAGHDIATTFADFNPNAFTFSGYLWRAEADWAERLDASMDEYRVEADYPDNVLLDILNTQLQTGETAWNDNSNMWGAVGNVDQAGRIIEVAQERGLDTTDYEARYQTLYDDLVVEMDAHCTAQPGECVL